MRAAIVPGERRPSDWKKRLGLPGFRRRSPSPTSTPEDVEEEEDGELQEGDDLLRSGSNGVPNPAFDLFRSNSHSGHSRGSPSSHSGHLRGSPSSHSGHSRGSPSSHSGHSRGSPSSQSQSPPSFPNTQGRSPSTAHSHVPRTPSSHASSPLGRSGSSSSSDGRTPASHAPTGESRPPSYQQFQIRNFDESLQIAIEASLQLAIEALPEGEWNEEPFECALCLDQVEVGMRARRLGCLHAYHTECIDRWLCEEQLGKHRRCPLCNADPITGVVPSREEEAARDRETHTAAGLGPRSSPSHQQPPMPQATSSSSAPSSDTTGIFFGGVPVEDLLPQWALSTIRDPWGDQGAAQQQQQQQVLLQRLLSA